MKARPLLAVIALSGWFACGGSGKAPAAPEPVKVATPAQVVAAANGLLEQYRQAYEVRSMDALAPLYSQTVDVVVIHQGDDHRGWSAVSTYLQDLLGRATEVHVKIGAVSVTALGSGGAAISAELTREISDGVTTIVEKGSLTLAIGREGQRWVIIHEHFSFPPKVT